MAPESPLGRTGGASWDGAGCFRFSFAIDGPGAGPSRDWAAKGAAWLGAIEGLSDATQPRQELTVRASATEGAVTILTRPGKGWRAGRVRNFRLRTASH